MYEDLTRESLIKLTSKHIEFAQKNKDYISCSFVSEQDLCFLHSLRMNALPDKMLAEDPEYKALRRKASSNCFSKTINALYYLGYPISTIRKLVTIKGSSAGCSLCRHFSSNDEIKKLSKLLKNIRIMETE